MEIKEAIVGNFYQDYNQLTNNGSLKELVCLVGASYDYDNIFDENPYGFLLKKKEDFLFHEIQNLIDEKTNQFWLGVKLAFIDHIRLEEEITRIYIILGNKIRCV